MLLIRRVLFSSPQLLCAMCVGAFQQSVTHSGKRPCQRPLVNTAAGHPSKSFRVHDSQSGESYLVDTGAEISLLPPTDCDRKFRTRGSPLRAANDTDIVSFGERTKSLKLGTTTICWKFNVADVTQPILGADFPCHHGLLVDVRRRQLINAETLLKLLRRSQHRTKFPASLLSNFLQQHRISNDSLMNTRPSRVRRFQTKHQDTVLNTTY